MKLNQNLELALHHARQGRRVFPFRLMPPDAGGRRAKIPQVKWKAEATTDEAQIRAWWERYPSSLPGWRLDGDVVVLDVDDPQAFADAGLEIDLSTASQVTPRGGYHLAYQGDGREIRQTVKEVPGADTRVSDLGWVGLYDFDSFDRPLAPAPGFLYAPRERPQAFGDDLEVMGTRDEILRYVGRLRRARMAEPEMFAALLAARDDGRIVALDESRPWEDADLKAIAKEAGKWEPGDPAQDLPTAGLVESLEKWKARHAGAGVGRPGRRRDDPDPVDDMPLFIPLREVDPSAPRPLVLGFLDPDEHTILFGDGGTGKGMVGAWWTAQLSREDLVFVLDYEAHARFEWRPRVERFGGDMDRVFIAQPTNLPIWKVAARVREEIEAIRSDLGHEGRVWLVVDSVSYACIGSAVEDSTTAIQYSSAIAAIGLPTVSLAHTTKTDADPKHPFGSVFWSNGARVTIGMTGTRQDPWRRLENKKTNQRGYFPTVELDWAWASDPQGSHPEGKFVKGEYAGGLAMKVLGGNDSMDTANATGLDRVILEALDECYPEGMSRAELLEVVRPHSKAKSDASLETILKRLLRELRQRGQIVEKDALDGTNRKLHVRSKMADNRGGGT